MNTPLKAGQFDLFNVYARIFEGFATRMAELLVAHNGGDPSAEPEMDVLWEQGHTTWEAVTGLPPIASDEDWEELGNKAEWNGKGSLTGRADAIVRWFGTLPAPEDVPT